MRRLFLIVLAIVILSSCTQKEKDVDEEASEQSILSEKEIIGKIDMNILDDVKFEYEGEPYEAKFHVECKSELGCSSNDQPLTLKEIREEINPVKIDANIGDHIKLNIPETLSKPDQIIYSKQQGATGSQVIMDDYTIEVSGERNEEIVGTITFNWVKEAGGEHTSTINYYFIIPNPK
ncbi:hypothetical protein H0266_14785 [Halobacillus locisalis]|uniref:Lipoprotein n=1 Tax=Halobacillus locisalis TaxID=220753 RepID=A0A838CW19_9BACI|nr:hypothetical protein [Halobacillus locisalis]MBA2176160.1 hypothetical protein [Halobacillus locisalis]